MSSNYNYNNNNFSSSNSDGWILYYTSEGHPYYYNEYTGESQWAEYEDYSQNKDPDEELERYNKYNISDDDDDDEYQNNYNHNYNNYGLEEQEEDNNNDYNNEDDNSPQNYSDDESLGTEEYEEQEFQEYLKSEAGRLAYEVITFYLLLFLFLLSLFYFN